jgi:hypothetical protein
MQNEEDQGSVSEMTNHPETTSMTSVSRQRCGECGLPGHNRRRCPNRSATQQTVSNQLLNRNYVVL